MSESAIEKWKKKQQQAKKDPGAFDRIADRQARLIMTSFNVFDPLVSAALWGKKTVDDPVYSLEDDFEVAETFQDKINTVSRLWAQSIDLVQHVTDDFKAVGIDLLQPENRWVYRKIIPTATRMIGKAEVNEKQFNLEAIKRAYSAIGSIVLGRAMPGVGDDTQAQQLVDKYANKASQNLLQALSDDEGMYSIDKTQAVHIAKLNAMSEVAFEVEEFAFLQGARGEMAKHEIKGRLSNLIDESAGTLFRLTIGIDENGEPNDAYALATSDDSRRMLMMRCIAEAGHHVCRIYQKYAGAAVREIVQNQSNPELYKAAQLKHYHQGPPYEFIGKELNESVQVLSSAAISGSAYLNQLMDNPLHEQEQSIEPNAHADKQKQDDGEKKPEADDYGLTRGNLP